MSISFYLSPNYMNLTDNAFLIEVHDALYKPFDHFFFFFLPFLPFLLFLARNLPSVWNQIQRRWM